MGRTFVTENHENELFVRYPAIQPSPQLESRKGATMKSPLTLIATGLFLAAVSHGLAQSALQFAASTTSVVESAGSVALDVRWSNGPNAPVSVDYATADGTATNGLKYTAVFGTLVFSAGQTKQTILVPILNNGFVEGTKTFKVILSNPTNAVLGPRTTAAVSITDNDVGINFQFATYAVAEDAGAVLIGVVRGDDGTLPVTVDLATTDLTATHGLDYAGLTNTLAFEPNERLKFFSVPILNNGLQQPDRTFRVTLSQPTGGTLGATKTTTVTIVDNEQGFQFESASGTVAEDAGAALIGVLRGTDDTSVTATVDYATTDITATSGLDYTATHGTLAFAPGEEVKRIAVPILNDGITEPSESFRVTLSNPAGGAVLGPRTTNQVTILDNDPGLGLELSSYSVWEKTGEIALTVVRGNDGTLGPITVDYATVDGSAKAGVHYQAVSGTLTFQANETVKNLTVPILQGSRTGAGKNFRVTLSHPTGGATLGTATTTVSILENYATVTPPFDARLAIRQDGGVNLLTWTGGGQLQRADRVEGPWQTLAAARSPWTVQSPVPVSFYQVKGIRPVNLYVPSGYTGQNPRPLVILLHGYGSSGAAYESILSWSPVAEARSFFYCYPDGTIDRWGSRFWNATDACCDSGNTGVDDAGYLRGLIEEIARRFVVDRKRIYLIGHSNGGYMAYRMACQSADLIAGIAAVAGETFTDSSRCAPAGPVNILHIHGTADSSVLYGGGAGALPESHANMPPYPGAVQTVQTWAGYNGAHDPVTDPAPSMDLVRDVAGLDTVVTRYSSSPPGGAVELWTINGAPHTPTWSSEFTPRLFDWLLAHPKP